MRYKIKKSSVRARKAHKKLLEQLYGGELQKFIHFRLQMKQ